MGGSIGQVLGLRQAGVVVAVLVGGPAVAVRVGVSAGGVALGVAQAGSASNSTALVVVVAVLKPSTTITRPSGNSPCACPARFVSIAGPGLKVPLLMLNRCVAVVDAPVASAPSAMSNWPVVQGEIDP